VTKHYKPTPLGPPHADGLYDLDGCTMLLDAILNGWGGRKIWSTQAGRRVWMQKYLPKTWLMLDGEEMFSRQGRTT